jgi:hypothetical protein
LNRALNLLKLVQNDSFISSSKITLSLENVVSDCNSAIDILNFVRLDHVSSISSSLLAKAYYRKANALHELGKYKGFLF